MKKYFPLFLLLYHWVFAFIGWQYIVGDHGDAVRYWFVGQEVSAYSWKDFFQPGTDIIHILTFPFVRYLHLPFWGGFVIFSAWSGYGFYRLWKLIKSIIGESDVLFYISAVLLLLPNVHFWTSLIGKESFLFVPFVVLIEQVWKQRYFSAPLLTALFAIGIVRPHAAFVVIIALLLSLLFKGKMSLKNKVLLSGAAAVVVVIMYITLSKITNAGSHLLDRIALLYQVHNDKLKATSAYVPLEEYSYPYKIFTFYFRPLPLENKGLWYRMVEAESVVILLMGVFLLFWIFKNFTPRKPNVFLLFAILLLIFYGTMYGYAYANFGMIVRTRTLVMPALYLLLIEGYRGKGSGFKVQSSR